MDEINILSPQVILNTVHYAVGKATSEYVRDGIELEKGAVLSEKRIDRHFDLYAKYCEYWSIYPDQFLELITPTTSKFKLKFFQIMFLRICLRNGRVLTIAPRAAGKSFICVLALYLICIFRPGSHVFICTPGKQQGAKVATQKIRQLWDLFPLLKQELVGEGNFGSDYVCKYRHASQ